MLKKHILILFIIIILLSGCYYIPEGYSLLKTYSKAKDINKLLKKGDIPENEKEFFLMIKKIKDYAINNLGLKENKNYSKYIRIEKDYLVDVVTACEIDSFNQYEWNYLFMGKMPYKGFFKNGDALKEAQKFDTDKYDVYISEVDAFSTLGILRDPLFSFMMDYSIYGLADLIFHEQTHATIFLKDKISFNENLANFIGTEGAFIFIKETYGTESNIYKNTIDRIEDSKKFKKLLTDLYEKLSLIYNKNISKKEKIELKKIAINSWKNKFKVNYEKEFKTKSYRRIPEIEINNAYITIYRSYTKDLGIFYELYEYCNNDLVKFIEVVKKTKKYKGEPKKYIRNYIDGKID